MRIGLQIPSFTYPGGTEVIRPTLKTVAQKADAAGFYSLWVMDHFFQIQGVGAAEEPMLEAYSVLSFFAALTEKIKLGALVTGVVYRYPGILIKTATTLDVLAGGRSYLGIGAAWFEREAKGLGVPYPPLKNRYEQLEDALQIARQMWAEKVEPFNGKQYQLAETLNHPQPLNKIPILIGGMGENKTFRLIAKYGDACNFFTYGGPKAIQQKMDALRQRCDEEGRDFATIEKTGLTTVDLRQTPAKDVITQFRELASVGIQHMIVNMPNTYTITPLETFEKEIIPAVAEF